MRFEASIFRRQPTASGRNLPSSSLNLAQGVELLDVGLGVPDGVLTLFVSVVG